ncbi:MAG: sodium-dependent transporter, partial [Candidatus ainarchaeum sp.]|nr:sodium-dependent transporter [Candidatus ainarchaeum sp.]
MVTDHSNIQEGWSGGKAFLIAAIASAVGVGNIWRFPYMAAENGGGSFILLTIIGVLFFGIPLMILEFLVGSKIKKTPVSLFKELLGKNYLIVYIPLILMFILASYYMVVTGWTLAYLIFSLFGSEIPFSEFSVTNYSLYSTLAVILLIFIILKMGIHNGLERINRYLVPAFIVSLIILTFGAISIFGVDDALAYYTHLDWNFISNPTTWVLAFSQAFFSLGVGWCIMLTYSAYLKKKVDIVLSSFVVSIVDTSIALVACLMIFSLAFGYGIPMDSGPSLAFEALPKALHSLPFAEIALP